MTRTHHLARICLVVAVLIVPTAPSAQLTAAWHVNTGLLPDDFCPWTLVKTAPGSPVLNPGFLLLSTTAFGSAHNMRYEQTTNMAVPDPWIIETRVRFVSGSSNNAARAPVTIVWESAPNDGNSLYIDDGEVFLLSSSAVKGASALVPTSDTFHTYRIEIAASGAVDVFYDGGALISGSEFPGGAGFARVLWGEISSNAFGSSEWTFFSHNGSTVECDAQIPVESVHWGLIKSRYQ